MFYQYTGCPKKKLTKLIRNDFNISCGSHVSKEKAIILFIYISPDNKLNKSKRLYVTNSVTYFFCGTPSM